VRRRLWRALRPLPDTIRLALALGVLMSPGSACLAGVASPVFQGTITSPTLCSPRGTALAPGGGLFVGSDCHALHHMEQFDAAGQLIGTWPFPSPTFGGPPNGVAIDGSGNVFVTDTEGNRILKCTSSGALITAWNVPFARPVDVAVDGFGDVYVAEVGWRRVRKTTPDGVLLATFGGAGSAPGQFESLSGVAVDASGRVYGMDGVRNRVVRFLANGTFDMEFAPPNPPSDVAVGPDGKIYVISSESHLVYRYSLGGVLLDFFDSPLGLDLAFRIIIDDTGMIFVTEQYSNRVTKFQIDLATPAIQLTFGRLKVMYR
jgi:outer membrane protein assembly factor BamB